MDFDQRLTQAQNQLRPFFLNLTKDPFLAEEVIQFASVQCWLHWRKKDLTELKRLMVTVGRRFYFNHREKERNQKNRLALLVPYFSQTPSPESLIQESELCEQVVQSLKRLPDKWREVLDRVFYREETIAEAAKAMGYCRSTIKTWRLRGLKRLRSILGTISQNLLLIPLFE